MSKRSLGTLTLDLIARTAGFVAGMTEAERASDKWRKKVEQNAKVVGQAVGIGVSAAVGALSALTVQTVRAADEVQRFSAVAGSSPQEFQRYSAGARLLGIEQEKLADIFKDTNDKIGDFLETGGGAMADFFENIAPRVGVTADQFRKLSGPQALGLYVDSLEKANLTQSQMTFYMEAIASDSTMLLPLLRNNAEGFKLLGEQAEAAGSIMGDDTLKSAQELRVASFLLGERITGIKTSIATALLPTLSALAGAFQNNSEKAIVSAGSADVLSSIIRGVAASAIGAWTAVDLLGRSIAGLKVISDAATQDTKWYELLFPALTVFKKWDDISNAAKVVGEDLEEVLGRQARLIEDILNAGTDGGNTNKIIEQFVALLEDTSKGLGSTGGAASDASDDLIAYGKTMKAVGEELDEFFRNEDYLLGQARESGEALIATTKTQADVLTRQIAVVGKGERAHAALNRELHKENILRSDSYQKLLPSQQEEYLRTQMEVYDLAQALAEANKAQQLVDQEAERIAQDMATAYERGIERIRDGFGDFFEKLIVDGRAKFSDLVDLFKRMIAEMIATAAANRIILGVGLGSVSGGAAAMVGGGGGALNLLSTGASILGAGQKLWQGFAGLATGQGLSGFAGLFGGHAANAALIPQHMLTRAASQQAAAITNFTNTVGPILAGLGGAIQGWQSGNRMNAVTGALGGWGGAKAGAAAGTYFMPGIGTAIGAVLGGILGSSLGSSVFGGAWENRRSGIRLGFDDEGLLLEDWIRQTKKGGWFGSTKRRYIYSEMEEAMADEFRTGYDAMIDVLGTQFMAIGADLDRAVFEGVRIGAASINTSDQTEEQIQEQIEKWFNDLNAAMIKGALDAAGDASSAVRLLRATGGDSAMLEALGGLMGVAGRDAVAAARAAHTQLSMVESYRTVTEATRELIGEYDGSLDATYALTEAMGIQQELAYGLASAYLQANDAVGLLFGNLSETIRTSLMDAEELYEYQRSQVHSLTDLLGTLTDPEAILRTSEQIERLVSGMWGRLDDSQRMALGDEFLDYVDRTQALAQDRLAQGLAEVESTQAEVYNRLTTQMDNVADRMNEATRQMQTAAELQNYAASQFASYVQIFGSYVSGMGSGREVNA